MEQAVTADVATGSQDGSNRSHDRARQQTTLVPAFFAFPCSTESKTVKGGKLKQRFSSSSSQKQSKTERRDREVGAAKGRQPIRDNSSKSRRSGGKQRLRATAAQAKESRRCQEANPESVESFICLGAGCKIGKSRKVVESFIRLLVGSSI
jgi:hypothetical protein